MLEVYFKDKKRTKDLEVQLEGYNVSIDNTTKRIEHIRTNAGKLNTYTHTQYKILTCL